MPNTFPLVDYARFKYSLLENCVVRNDCIVPNDPRRSASFQLETPTCDYKDLSKVTYPDQVWAWVPKGNAWVKNHDRVLREVGRDEMEEVYRYVALAEYLRAMRGHRLTQGKINEHISQTNTWGDYPIMRSMNTHDPAGGKIQGITPRHFRMICELDVAYGKGHPLTDSEKW